MVLCTIPFNPDAGSLVADFMNGNVTQWNMMIRNLTAENPNELRLMDVQNALRMVDHSALTRDGIHFNTQQGIEWINDPFQTRIEEIEAEVRTMVNPVARGSPAGRVRFHVPHPLANRLGPLTTEVNVVQPTPSSDVTPQATTSTTNQPTSALSAQRISQADAAAVLYMSKVSEFLWIRPDPSPWGQHKADMAIKLNMMTLTFHEDVKKMLNGHGPMVSRLYIAAVDWLLAEEEQFSSATTLRLVDLEGLPRDNTMRPLNTRSLTDVHHQMRERAPPNRKGKFLVEKKPNNKHHKMYKQFAKPPGQSADEYSREYPRVNSVEGDKKRYAHLESPKGDSLFAAYDTQ